MKRPFLHVFIFYLLGIMFVNIFSVNIALVKMIFLVKLGLGVLTYPLKQRNEYFKYILLGSIFLLGIISTNTSLEKHKLPRLYDEKVQALGLVKEVTSKDEEYEKYLLHIEKINYKDKVYKIEEKLIFNIYDQTDLRLGDRVLADLQIKEPKENTNPKLFNYKRHLESKGIFATASTNKKHQVKILSRDDLSGFEKISSKVKSHIRLSLDASLNEENSNIIKSIILGDDSFLSEESINSFRKLGLSHILAVSGLHIGIIFAFIIYILDLFKVHRKKSMVTSMVIIWAYALLIGLPASVIRASLMFSFLALARISHRRYDSVNILALAGLLMLVYRPMSVFGVGFQLSFIATFTILFFIKKMQNIVDIKNKKLKSAVVIVLTVQLGVLPVSIYYFNEFQTLSILANLIIAPLLTLGIIIGFVIIFVSGLSLKLGILIGVLGNLVLNISNFIVNALTSLTSLNIWMRSPSAIEIALYYLALVILLKIIDLTRIDKKIQRCICLNFLIVLSTSLAMQLGQESASLEFIDVGQGDSCLVRLKSKDLLIDTGGNIFGGFDIGENILLPYLRKTGVKSLDGVFLSHYHADHVKGLIPLFGHIGIKNIFIGYENLENDLYKEILKSADQHGVRVKLIDQGDKLKIDDNTSIEVLHPPKAGLNYDNENDKSLVFILNIYNRQILYTGDMEEASEDFIVKNTKSRNVDIIKVPHHGSKTSSKAQTIDHFNPKFAIFQVGKNSFGHPNEDVLDRYHANDTKVLRNDRSGLIKAQITKKHMSFEGYVKDQQTFLEFLTKDTYILIYALSIGSIYLLVVEYKKRQEYKL